MKLEPTTKIWLKFGGTKFLIPVNPKDLSIDRSASPDNFDIVSKGQIAVPQYSNLQTIKFKSFFPGLNDAPFVSSEAMTPEAYYDILHKALDEAQIGRFVIKRPGGLNQNIRVIIRKFVTTDTGGEPYDLPYEIELSEYRDYKAKKVKVKKKKTKSGTKNVAVTQKQRDVDSPKMRVGASVIANGTYCYDSNGSNPHGTANNLQTEVKRIVSGSAYPILIGSYGWIKESNVQVRG